MGLAWHWNLIWVPQYFYEYFKCARSSLCRASWAIFHIFQLSNWADKTTEEEARRSDNSEPGPKATVTPMVVRIDGYIKN